MTLIKLLRKHRSFIPIKQDHRSVQSLEKSLFKCTSKSPTKITIGKVQDRSIIFPIRCSSSERREKSGRYTSWRDNNIDEQETGVFLVSFDELSTYYRPVHCHSWTMSTILFIAKLVVASWLRRKWIRRHVMVWRNSPRKMRLVKQWR